MISFLSTYSIDPPHFLYPYFALIYLLLFLSGPAIVDEKLFCVDGQLPLVGHLRADARTEKNREKPKEF